MANQIIRLDPFQEIVGVQFLRDSTLEISYSWGGDARDLDTVTTVSGIGSVGYGFEEYLQGSDGSFVDWSGDATGTGGIEIATVWGKHCREKVGSRIITVTCAAHWYPSDEGPAQVLFSVYAYAGARYPSYGGKLKQSHFEVVTISSRYNSPQTIRTVRFDTGKGSFELS